VNSQGCSINLVGISGNYVNDYVTVYGEGTYNGNSQCPYTSIDVTSQPVVQSQQIVQATTTAPSTITTTVTQSSTTQPLTIQPTTDYTPILLVGFFVLAAIALIGFFVYMIRRPASAHPEYPTQPTA
jgi:hypothetical protein